MTMTTPSTANRTLPRRLPNSVYRQREYLTEKEVERLMAEIGRWMDAQKQIKSFLGSGAKATMDQKTLEQLRSLGYIGGKQ